MADERWVERGGRRIRCCVSGRGEPVFLCLHGLADTLEIWDRFAPALAARGTAIRFDQRGHGGSAAPAGLCTREDLAADALAVQDAFEVERAIAVGHSLGGVVAMALALAQPSRVAGLVLLGTASQCNARTSEWYERIALAGERAGLAGIAEAIYRDPTRRLRGDGRAMAAVARTLRSLHADPLTPKLAAIACPALLLVGENDPMGPRASELIRDALPRGSAALAVLPGRGHWLHVEAADDVARELDRWLREAPTEERR